MRDCARKIEGNGLGEGPEVWGVGLGCLRRRRAATGSSKDQGGRRAANRQPYAPSGLCCGGGDRRLSIALLQGARGVPGRRALGMRAFTTKDSSKPTIDRTRLKL